MGRILAGCGQNTLEGNHVISYQIKQLIDSISLNYQLDERYLKIKSLFAITRASSKSLFSILYEFVITMQMLTKAGKSAHESPLLI